MALAPFSTNHSGSERNLIGFTGRFSVRHERTIKVIGWEEVVVPAGRFRALRIEAEGWGRKQGCRSVMLSSNVVRTPAHAFYAALGYHIAATSNVLRKELPRK